MHYFSKSKPSLISSKTLKHIDKLVQGGDGGKLQPDWKKSATLFYGDYVKPNLLPLIVLFIVVIYLTIRYVIKKNKDEEVSLEEDDRGNIKNDDNAYERKKGEGEGEGEGGDKNKVINVKGVSGNDDSDCASVTELPELEPVYMGNDGDDDSIYNLERAYRIDKENGNMSDQMLKDLYQKKNQKMSFDELARVVAGN